MQQRKIATWLFVLYLLLMLFLLFHRPLPDLSQKGYWKTVQNNLALKPLKTISDFWDILCRKSYYLEKLGAQRYAVQQKLAIVNLFGNVVMFLPLGFFPPVLWSKMRSWWKMLLACAGGIIAVELAQLFTLRGTCDIDDLILNLLGCAIGFSVFCLLRALICKKES